MPMEKDPFDRHFDSFTSLADLICETLHCPITIENANHQLIAYSSHSPQTDQARIATIVGRRVPEQVISALWRNGVIQKLMECEDPVRIEAVHDVGLGDRIAIAIRKHNEILGYIWAMEENERLGSQEFALLKRAAQASKHLMLQLQIQKRKEEEGQQNLFWQLLTGHLKSPGAIKEQAKLFNISLPSSFQVIVFQFEQEITDSLFQRIQYMITTTQSVKIVLHVVDGFQLILLTSWRFSRTAAEPHHSSSGFIRDFMEQMKERFGIAPVDGASGNEFDDYTVVERAWKEALSVLELKKHFPAALQDAHQHRELGFYRYFPMMTQSDGTPLYENSGLRKLRGYDTEHNSCLLETLDVFLNHDSSLKDTADALHIHINTLNYRLKRITEIGGIDLKNMDHKVSLYLDLRLMKLSK
ncbi:helix-turn-helix domain-containing protein [Paenibacillus sp. RC67]|uniref:PucR family transcriptional regulator n=1 Tax=Paenibacillus sp. RC67 TaxID=3039392 RepID=UPI0024AD9ED6|nr:helix-turn-helix domain-containing protein [Paenibacillus sp. RC67]